MSLADLYVTVLVLGAGVGVAGFWTFALATDRVDALGDFGSSRTNHIVAEYATAAVALAAGIARLADDGTTAATVLTAVALGMIAYAVLQSTGYYRQKQPMLVWVLTGTGIAVIPAVVILVTRS